MHRSLQRCKAGLAVTCWPCNIVERSLQHKQDLLVFTKEFGRILKFGRILSRQGVQDGSVLLQIMMATDDGEVVSSCLQRGVWSVPSRELVSDILHVRVSLMQNSDA